MYFSIIVAEKKVIDCLDFIIIIIIAITFAISIRHTVLHILYS